MRSQNTQEIEHSKVLANTWEVPEDEAGLDREGSRSECALGVFVYAGPGSVSYYGLPQKLQASQGRFRGGGGRGLVMNAMTRHRALSILKNAGTRSNAVQIYGETQRVDLEGDFNLEVIQLHCAGREVEDVVQGIRSTGVRPLYVELIKTSPGGLSLRSFRDTFGDIDPGRIERTFIRVFVDNGTSRNSSQLQQAFHHVAPGPVVLSWSSIDDFEPGLLCYKVAGRDREFDEFFRPDLEEFSATQIMNHSRFPTVESKPGAENCQPVVDGRNVSMHNGDAVSAYVAKQRLRDPNSHRAEIDFFKRYGKPNIPFVPKRPYVHIPSVDSAMVAPIHTYLFDCCKRHGIDPMIISLLERPPSIAQIEVMPPREREFFLRARMAFPEFNYQGSAATVVRTDEYIRITPDRTRVLWIAKDFSGNVYVASNGGAITNACAIEDIVSIRPVEACGITDIDLKTFEIKNKGLEFFVPGGSVKDNGAKKRSVFIPGIGFDPKRLEEISIPREAAKQILHEGKEELQMPKQLSREFGVYGFEALDIQRLVHYANTGKYLAIGLGNYEPDGLIKRTTDTTHLTSTHQAFIVSPGRDNRIEFSAKTLLRNGSDVPLVLNSPVLMSSAVLHATPDGQAVLKQIAEQYGTLCVSDLKNNVRIKTTYLPNEKLEDAIKRVLKSVEEAALGGCENIILDDAVSGNEIPMSCTVISGAVHHHLRRRGVPVDMGGGIAIQESLRSRVNLIGEFCGIKNAEDLRECIMHGLDAVAPSLALDAGMGIFQHDGGGHLTAHREAFIKRGVNALLGFEDDFAIAAGSSGFHDVNAMRGNAPGMAHELGIAKDLNKYIGNIPGMEAGGVDIATLDLFMRSRSLQYSASSVISTDELPDYKGGLERWNPRILKIIDRMTREGATYRFDPKEYDGLPVVTLEDLVQIKGLQKFKEFSDEELRGVNLRVLDFVGVMIAHMSIGADNIETWIEIFAALYELRHEIANSEIPFLNEDEQLILAGIGEGGIAAEIRLFLSHIVSQYASGRFGVITDDGDIFDRQHLLKEGLLRMHGIKTGAFSEEEISDIEKLIVRLIKSEHLEADLAAAADGSLFRLCRFLSMVCDKNAQDAKRGYGGMLEKTIGLIARIRGVTRYDPVKSFFNHADGDSIEELRERIFSAMREAAGEIPELGDQEVGLWSKDAMDPYAAANFFGQVKAGAVFVDHDWRGGTGNRPAGTMRASHPWMAEVRHYDAADRAMLGLMTSNWMSSNRTPVDAMRNILWGHVDGVLIASSLLRAMKCIFGNCRNCHTGQCAPLLTDQRKDKREKLHVFDDDEVENPESRKINAVQQKYRAKRFMLAFLRSLKVLLKNLEAQNLTQAKGRRDDLEVLDNAEVEGAGWIRALTDHPYSLEEIERACSISERFNGGKFIEKEQFPAEPIMNTLRAYMDLSTEGVSNERLARNSFLVMGDIVNVMPKLTQSERIQYMSFLRKAFQRLQEAYHYFLKESGQESSAPFSRDALLERYKSLDFLTDRTHQEYLERMITAFQLLELAERFCENNDEHELKDDFFARTVHSSDEKISIKSPRAILSQENGFTIDRYRGAQRKVAHAVISHIQNNTEKKPLVIEIDEVMTDADMGILTCLNAIFHAMPERFQSTVESIELYIKRGVTGHNLGAMVDGDYLFGIGEGKKKLRIILEGLSHADGSAGMSANGATMVIRGYAGDCTGAYASDFDFAVRGASVKLGMGAKGDSFCYSHEYLRDVAGIGMNGNATIFCAGMSPPGEELMPIARPGTGGAMQGISHIIFARPADELKKSLIPGVGTAVKGLSRLDEAQAKRAYGEFYPIYEGGKSAPEFSLKDHSKIVSVLYNRDLVTSLLVFDFEKMRGDCSFDEQLMSAAGEMLEYVGIDDRDPKNSDLLDNAVSMLKSLREKFLLDHAELISEDQDAAFLKARSMANEFLQQLKQNPPKMVILGETIKTQSVFTPTSSPR